MLDLRIRPIIPFALRPAGIETFIDLFAGIGGFHYAAASLGLRCAFASEIDEAASEQYLENFGLKPFGDITRVKAGDIPDHEILFAGFPCQPFSIIGDMKSTTDERGTLFHEILRIVEAKQPKSVVLENVRQFASIEHGTVLQAVLDGLEGLGYRPRWRILNALDFGLPQKRERTIIVAMKHGIDMFEWPDPKTESKSLDDVLEKNPDQKYFVSPAIRKKRHDRHTAKIKPAIWHENKGGNIASHPYSCALRAGASYNYLLVDGERRLTPREMLRLQGFPESFKIVGGYGAIRKQTGNAVPVPMVRAVIRKVLYAAAEHQRQNENTQATRTISA